MKKIRELKALIAHELPFFLSVPAVIWQVIFLYIPLIIIFYFSLYKGPFWYTLTLQHYTTLVNWVYVRIIGRSLAIAISVAVFCFLCAYPISYYLAVKVSRRWKNTLLFLLTMPFWTNFLIQVYSWFFLLDRNGLINLVLLKIGIISKPLYMANNLFAILLVMVYCYVPFMIMPLYSILEKIEHDVLEASMDLGATHWQTFVRVTLPLSISGIKTGVLFVFVPAFGEFAIPALIGGSRHMMVGSLISHYFLISHNSAPGAAFTLLSGFILLIVALIFNHYCRISHMKRTRR